MSNKTGMLTRKQDIRDSVYIYEETENKPKKQETKLVHTEQDGKLLNRFPTVRVIKVHV